MEPNPIIMLAADIIGLCIPVAVIVLLFLGHVGPALGIIALILAYGAWRRTI